MQELQATGATFSSADVAALLRRLLALDYRFVTPTPATHQRVLAKRPAAARDLRDVFGWSLPFEPKLIEPGLWSILQAGDLIEDAGSGLAHSRLRVSTLGGHAFAHSPFPTTAEDAVFFGPDSYRFAAFIGRHLDRRGGLEIVDLGAGSGVGGIVAVGLAPEARLVLVDINDQAIALARANADAAGIAAEVLRSDGLQAVAAADVILANPPYIADPQGRTYRDGGGRHGEAVALSWASEAVRRLRPGGQLLLYTGAPIVDGRDLVRDGLERLAGVSLHYEEIDPDVFGEELDQPAYAGVERIAAIGAVITRPPRAGQDSFTPGASKPRPRR